MPLAQDRVTQHILISLTTGALLYIFICNREIIKESLVTENSELTIIAHYNAIIISQLLLSSQKFMLDIMIV